jgi:hypothetical protein
MTSKLCEGVGLQQSRGSILRLSEKETLTQYGDPVQFIDARDLAEWTIRVAEQHITGV